MTTDRLALAHVIEDAGIERSKAERVASAIFDAINDNVATKQDIATVRADLALAVRDLKLWTGRTLFALFTLQVAAAGLLLHFVR